ncbi:hypothetical protein NW762_011093 [Fusarium torreyae]|uniref:Uncharacterized protein n=1 Tax=Fusarium torreyae TaxID=1237075 RepID=A0A9W8RS49_9HYPO|nr:hypothetical protein NW762_011093 [Fusarium torreyae]
MFDWNEDSFMSDWDAKYVSTNIKPEARKYDRDLFLDLNTKLIASHPELKSFSHAIIAAACCAVSRADVVGRFFDDITFDSTPEASERLFLSTREAITIVFPYIGMPTCIPACYGMIGVVERKGPKYASTRVLRKTTIDEEDVKKGITCSTVVTWGYLISKANEEVFQPNESHLIIAASIAALGATRQTKSHIKATLGIGNSISCVKSVLEVVSKIAEWADRPIGHFDVDALSQEIQKALKN